MFWVFLTDEEINQFAEALIKLVEKAYQNTELGSFIKTIVDVKSSSWLVLMNENKIVSTIFFRKPRPKEVWSGYKIQGIGHDGDIVSKKHLLNKLTNLLNSEGWWIEVSGKLMECLKLHLAPYTNQQTILTIFQSVSKFNYDGSYFRKINNSIKKETIFGRIILKRS